MSTSNTILVQIDSADVVGLDEFRRNDNRQLRRALHTIEEKDTEIEKLKDKINDMTKKLHEYNKKQPKKPSLSHLINSGKTIMFEPYFQSPDYICTINSTTISKEQLTLICVLPAPIKGDLILYPIGNTTPSKIINMLNGRTANFNLIINNNDSDTVTQVTGKMVITDKVFHIVMTTKYNDIPFYPAIFKYIGRN